MINTLNETLLHKTLKKIYQVHFQGKTEVNVGPYIIDIVAQDGGIIEIQTGSLGKLLKKIEYFLKEKRSVKIVYPIPTVKYIETKDIEGKIKKRKSPQKKSIYSVFREISSLRSVLLNKDFSLDIIETEITEFREKKTIKEQSRNGRRRFKKDWQKTGKKLEKIGKTTILHGKLSYKKLLPKNLPESFTSKEFYSLIQNENKNVKRNETDLMLWLYEKLKIIKITEKKGNIRVFSAKRQND